MSIPDDFSVIAALELGSIKNNLMHVKGKGWSLERASAVEREYRRFLYLMKKFPNESTAPPIDVDTFWHYHILDTVKYADDCERVFGYFLHHFPYVGMRGKEDEEALQRMGECMRIVYEETFGEDYDAAARACTEAAAKPAYCGVTTNAANCGATTKTAFCTTATKPAYCTAATKPAYCGVATRPAYCGVASKSAYCGVTAAEPAYCGVTTVGLGASDLLPREQRPGFYLERPTLAN